MMRSIVIEDLIELCQAIMIENRVSEQGVTQLTSCLDIIAGMQYRLQARKSVKGEREHRSGDYQRHRSQKRRAAELEEHILANSAGLPQEFEIRKGNGPCRDFQIASLPHSCRGSAAVREIDQTFKQLVFCILFYNQCFIVYFIISVLYRQVTLLSFEAVADRNADGYLMLAFMKGI